MALYEFGVFTLDSENLSLTIKEGRIDASDKIIQFLVLLLESNGELVSKDDIFDALWPGQIVSEASLSRLVSDTRQLLAKFDERPFIRTIRGKGFRFDQTLRVAIVENESPPQTSVFSRHVYLLGFALFIVSVVFWLNIKDEPSLDDLAGFTIDSSSTVLILPTDITTSDDQDAWVKFGLMTMLTKTLEGYSGISVISVESTLAALGSLGISDFEQRDFSTLCFAMNCDYVVQSTLYMQGDSTALSYRLVGERQTSPDFHFPNNNIMTAGRLMASHLLSNILPKQTERLSLKSLYSDNPDANQNFALGANALHRGDYLGAKSYLELALRANPDYFWASAYLAESLYKSGDLDASEALLDKLSRKQSELDSTLFLENVRANILYTRGELQESNDVSERLIAQAELANNKEVLGILLMNTGSSYTALGELDKATDFLLRALAVFSDNGYKLREAQARLNLANALYLRDAVSQEAVEQYSKAEKLFRQFDAKGYLAYALTSQMHLKVDRDKFDEALSILAEIEQVYQEIGDVEGELLLLTEKANIAMKRGQLEFARAYLEKALDQAGSEYTFVRSHAAKLLTLVGLNTGDLTLANNAFSIIGENQWQDNRAVFALLGAHIAHASGELEEAVNRALSLKEQLQQEWSGAHQAYLELYEEDYEKGERYPIDYIAGKRL